MTNLTRNAILFSQTSAIAPWTPLQLANLIGFWRADIGVVQSGGNVTAWNDQSPAGNNLTAVNSPTWSTTKFNTSFPGVGFSQPSIQHVQNTSFPLAASSQLSVFLLFSNSATPGQSFPGIISFLATGDPHDDGQPHSFVLSNQGFSPNLIGWDFDFNYLSVYGPASVGPTLIGVTYNAATGIGATYFNSQTPFQAQNNLVNTIGVNPNTLTFGYRPSEGDNSWTGVMAYMIITASAMRAADIANLFTWTNTNWGMSLPGPPGPTWTPMQLPGLVGFWRADIGVAQTAGVVTSWADQSGNGNTLTPVNGPTWTSLRMGVFNGYPAVSLNAASSQYLHNTSFNFSSSQLSCWVLFANSSASQLSSFPGIVSFLANGDTHDFSSAHSFNFGNAGNSATVFGWDQALTGVQFTANGSGPTLPNLSGMIMDGTHCKQYNNSQTPFASPADANTVGVNPNNLAFGFRPSEGGDPWTGDLSFMIITSQAMSATDISNLFTWTNINWGLSF